MEKSVLINLYCPLKSKIQTNAFSFLLCGPGLCACLCVVCTESVRGWGKRPPDFFWHTVLPFRDRLHLKANLVFPLGKKKKKVMDVM